MTGTVSGTVIKVLNATTNAVFAQTDTASLPGPPPFSFTLANIPIGVPIKIFFFSAGQTFPLYFGSPSTNVFTMLTSASIDLGFVTMSGGTATPEKQPSSASISLGTADPSVPPGVEPPPATLTVSTPAPASGSVIVEFSVQNFSIGGQGQRHLHIRVDGGPTRHFFNGRTNGVKEDNGNTTVDVVWQSVSSFRLNGLSVGQHQVSAKLATAADNEFTNFEANPPPVIVTINNPPISPPIVTITSPLPGSSFPSGPLSVSFAVQNFTIGSQNSPHLHIYLDGDPVAHFFNGTTNQVLDETGVPVSNMTRQSNTSFQITGLSAGSHQIRLALADGVDQELQNAEANPAPLNLSIQAPSGAASVTVTSGTSFLSSPVRVTFDVSNFTIGLPGTPHLRFSIDGGPLNDFYNGSGIDSDNGVLLNGVHTHFVHWTSTSSFDLFALAAGPHQVGLVLVDAGNIPLPNAEASITYNFKVQQPPTGELQLQSVLSGLSFPVGLSLAPDGRIFYNERLTGAIRIINPRWQLDSTPFCQISVAVSGEQGLLGLTLDPNFASNGFVYVYYTVSGATMNRVSKLSKSEGDCVETIILDNLPVSSNHNGGIIQFGPDGKLYVVIGDVAFAPNAQDLTSLAGKILRLNADGSAPSDNPFFGSGNANTDKVFSYGHRNSYGFTFHPQTNVLWESENGPADNDEINRVVAGGNYGWPIVGGIAGNPNYIDPILAFNPVIAPTGIIAIPGNSSVYPPAYRNNLLMAAWNDGTIRLVIPNGTNPDLPGTASVAYNGGVGGLLSFMLGPDGYVYVSNGDGILRVVTH